MGLGDPYEGVVHSKGVATCVRTTALDGAALSVRVFPGILDKKGGKEQRKEYLNYMQTLTSGSHRFPTLAQPESSLHAGGFPSPPSEHPSVCTNALICFSVLK